MVFSGSRINGGLPAEGFLDVRASSLSPDNNSLTGLQLVFDDTSINLPFNTKIIEYQNHRRRHEYRMDLPGTDGSGSGSSIARRGKVAINARY